MTVIGTPRNFHTKFKFVVEIDGVRSAAFMSCSELSVEFAVVEQWQGGAIASQKDPGRATFAPVTLSRGVTDDFDFFTWAQQVGDAAKQQGLANPAYKRNMDIVQLDRDGTELRRWRLQNCWPSKYKAGDWDNDADENVVEELQVEHEGFGRAA